MPCFCLPTSLQPDPEAGLGVPSWARTMAGLALSGSGSCCPVSPPLPGWGLHVTGQRGSRPPPFLAPAAGARTQQAPGRRTP